MYKYCNNCGKSGHIFKQCRQPITSFGFLVFHNGPSGNDPLKYLFINRKHSICYIEFIRGRYIYNKDDKPMIDTKYVNYLFCNMTKSERSRLVIETFDELWKELWSVDSKKHKYEYINAKLKYNTFKKGMVFNNKTLSLEAIISQTTSDFEHPEWEFPKGRKNLKETDLECAYREFCEETDLDKSNINIISDCPLSETYIGCNGTNYRGVYYMANFTSSNPMQYDHLELNPDNIYQISEIGNIKWFTIEEANVHIRPYNSMKYKVLNMANQYILSVYNFGKSPNILSNISSIQNIEETNKFWNPESLTENDSKFDVSDIFPNMNKFPCDKKEKTKSLKIPPGFEGIKK